MYGAAVDRGSVMVKEEVQTERTVGKRGNDP